MSFDALTTSGINSLVNSYIQNENSKRIAPLRDRQSKHNNLSSAYGKILNYLDNLKSSLSTLKTQTTNSIFKTKLVKSSNENKITATASSSAINGSYNLRVNQLAKNDTLLSIDKNSSSPSGITVPGEYLFNIKTADGKGGFYNSRLNLILTNDDFTLGNISFSSLASKISSAIQNDIAVVESNFVVGNNNSSGSFKFNFGGTEHTINYSQGDYEQVFDDIVTQLNQITGISAQKINSNGNLRLKVQSSLKSKYIQFKDDSGSLLSDIGISTNREFAASEVISLSVFSPSFGKTQLSISTKKSGFDYRIIEVEDITSNGVLNVFGLNIGSNRPNFQQIDDGEDIPGFLYSSSQLNANLTLNGIQVQRNSNEIIDLIEGVNIKLLLTSENNSPDITLTVSNNTSEIKSKVENFIAKFNELYEYLKDNSITTKEKRGLLVGDSSVRSLLNILNSYAIQSFGQNSINSLSKLGITFSIQNGLSISNENQLTAAIENNINDLETFFNSENGFATLFFNAIEPYTGVNGYIRKNQNQLNSSISQINDSIKSIENRIMKSAELLRSRYRNLQAQLATLLSNQFYFVGNFFNQIK